MESDRTEETLISFVCKDERVVDLFALFTKHLWLNHRRSMSQSITLKRMTADERRQKRKSKAPEKADEKIADSQDSKFFDLMSRNEDELLTFVARVNKVYQEKLKKPAPFMTFILIGMQSAGKSTLMERFMGAVLNIVQEGTGTRCPLNTTCIHDSTCKEPLCDLSGSELSAPGKGLQMNVVFERITAHNRKLAEEDRFSTEPLTLVFRSSNVQNMRFVDTPGIICNESTGKDNRDDIKDILVSEMANPNAKLCVLLEPKEFATNAIINFLDEKIGRKKWIDNAIFLMTKFDKQLDDSRSGSKANNFFREFLDNGCIPHLVITPTLDKEDLPPEQLFGARRQLLATAPQKEDQKFKEWLLGHENFLQTHGGNDELLNEEVRERIGFDTAKQKMREIMLKDTIQRLPEVISSLRHELDQSRSELSALKERKKLTDPGELKGIVTNMLWSLQKQMLSYLDGDLGSAMKCPDNLQTLEEEIDNEDSSDWALRELNFHSEKEDLWRDRIADLEGEYPPEVYPGMKFMGGKQIQRAISFYQYVLIEAMPDPFEIKDHVANATGYLVGDLHREAWERAVVQICKNLMEKVTHPGANYLVKHIGSIFRRLFTLALEDIKHGQEHSATYKLVPEAVERYLVTQFEAMLWTLMQDAAEKMNCVLEPMYSTVDPHLPTFNPTSLGAGCDARTKYVQSETGDFVELPSEQAEAEESWKEWGLRRLKAIATGSGVDAKKFLQDENRSRARSKKSFLPDERSAMITDEETQFILKRASEYLMALFDFTLVISKFQVNHYLYVRFKEEMGTSFTQKGSEADWSKLVETDPALDERIKELDDLVASLELELKEVQRMQQRV